MAKRIYWNTAKKWAIKAGIPTGVAGFALLFYYLVYLQAITITGYTGDIVCDGDIESPCIAYVNFTANEDIFLYPLGYDPWGRETPFYTDVGLKEWKMYRSWGSGWREIDLTDTCKGTWCGGKFGASNNAYSFAFRENRDYQIRIIAYKEDPNYNIKWGFGPVDPVFFGRESNVVQYSDNDLNASIIDALGNKIGDTRLTSHISVDEIRRVMPGKNRIVMTYKFTGFNRTIKDGLGDVIFINLKTNQTENKPYHFEYKEYFNVTKDVFGNEQCQERIVSNGTEKYNCFRLKIGETIEEDFKWKLYNSTDIPSYDIELALVTDVNRGDNYDGKWEIVGKSIDLHATWTESFNTGLVAYYNFTTQLESVFGGDKNLTIGLGTPVLIENSSTQGLGKSAYFDGGSLYEVINDDNVFSLNKTGEEVTINGWVKIQGTTENLIWLGKGDRSTTGWTLFNANPESQFTVIGGVNYGTSILPRGDWVMITFILNSSDTCTYINGTTMICSSGENLAGTNIHNFSFAGKVLQGGNELTGYLDEWGFWNRSLTATEIGDLYNNGTGITYTDDFPTTPPDINITFPFSNNSNSNNIGLNVNYTVKDANLESCWYSNDTYAVNLSLPCIGINSNITNVTWSEGNHNVTVWANDTDNNVNQSSISFTIDSINPDINITIPVVNNSNITNAGLDIEYTRSDINLESCWYSNDTYSVNITLANCANITTITWGEGNHNVTIWTNDTANNVNQSSISFIITSFNDLLLEGLNQSIEAELGTDINVTVNGTGTVCFDIDHPSYGINFSCGSTSYNITFNISFFRKEELNDTNSVFNLSYSGSQNQTIYVASHQYDEVVNFSFNLTGYTHNATSPTGVNIYVNNTLSNTIGDLFSGDIIEDEFGSNGTEINLTFDTFETVTSFTKNIILPKAASISNAQFNISGYNYTINVSADWTDNFNDSSLNTSLLFSGNWSCQTGGTDTGEASGVEENAGWVELKTLISENAGETAYSWSGLRTNATFSDGNNYTITFYINTSIAAVGSDYIIKLGNDSDFSSLTCGESTLPEGLEFLRSTNSFATQKKYDITINGSDSNVSLFEDGVIINSSIISLTDRYVSIELFNAECGGGSCTTASYVYVQDFQTAGTKTLEHTSYPSSVTIDIGDRDGTYEFEYATNFNHTQNQTDNFNSSLMTYLSTCTTSNCTVPIYITSGTVGVLFLENLTVTYTLDDNPYFLDLDLIRSFLGNSTNEADIPITIQSLTNGTIEIKDIRYDYAGGNKTYTIKAHNPSYTINLTHNVTFFYSDWDFNFPRFVNFLEFIPRTPTTKNVTPFGQTSTTPIFNITTYNYGGRNSNLSFYINQSISCVDLTLSNSSSKNSGNITDEIILANNGSAQTLSELPTNDLIVNAQNRTWLEFDGNDDYMLSDNQGDYALGLNYTAIVWVNITGIDETQYLFTDDTPIVTPLIFCFNNGNLQLRDASNTAIVITDLCNNNNGSWVMYSMAYNGTSYILYQNNTLIGEVDEVNTPIFSTAFVIGGTNDVSNVAVNGSIGEVRFYNQSLNTSELLSIYNNNRAFNVDVLDTINDVNQLLYLPLNENSGTTAYDLSEFSNNVTITGATYATDGINITLVNGTDFEVSGTTFTIINASYSWTELLVGYKFGFFVDGIWTDIFTNLEYLNNSQMWMFADYSCNLTTWQTSLPEIFVRGCANNTFCSEDLI